MPNVPPHTTWPVHPERTRARRPDEGPPHVLVVHTSEQSSNAAGTAVALARFIGAPATRDSAGKVTNRASYHWCVDSVQVCRLVSSDGIAYHAPPNWRGESVCLTGRAGRDWTALENATQLDLAAQLIAWRLSVRGWPARLLTVDQVRAGATGLCGHDTISAAFAQTDHTDPGRGFPWRWLIDRVQQLLAPPIAPPTTPPTEDSTMSTVRRVRVRGYLNVWLVGAGPALHLSPDLNTEFDREGVPLVVTSEHPQLMNSLLHQSGLTTADLVAGPPEVV